jgi:caffeoyl-CoA O-methyltransferase
MTTKPLCITEDLIHYVRAMQPEEPEILKRLGRETDDLPRATMRIGWDEGRLLMLLVKLVQARRTIEIGVFTGYSALCTAMALPGDGRILACDVSEPWTTVARRYWREANVDHKIDLRLGQALETLEGLLGSGFTGVFDMAFIDADKVNYQNYFECCLELLRPGGLIAVDNTLWYGRVIDPTFEDVDTLAIRAFNERLRTDSRVEACLTAVGDGLTLVVKKGVSA